MKTPVLLAPCLLFATIASAQAPQPQVPTFGTGAVCLDLADTGADGKPVVVKVVRPFLGRPTEAKLKALRPAYEKASLLAVARFQDAVKRAELPHLDPLPATLTSQQVAAGGKSSYRESLMINELLFIQYLGNWFRKFALAGDPVATPTDPSRALRICVGFVPGAGATTSFEETSMTDFQIVRGLGDFSKNVQPPTNGYLSEYTAISHELGHLLLRIHGQSLQAFDAKTHQVLDLPVRAEELRADCIAGYLLGLLVPGHPSDPRRERMAQTFNFGQQTSSEFTHGSWPERRAASLDGFNFSSRRLGNQSEANFFATESRIQSQEAVNYCILRYRP